LPGDCYESKFAANIYKTQDFVQPLVSILIPAYNAEKWIKATLGSAVKQDYGRTEIILVNDGSTDRTLEMAKPFEAKNMKIIDQPNGGGPAARNVALAQAQGDYIQWLDHDDLLAHNKISEQVRHLESIGSDRVLLTGSFGRFYFRPEKSRILPGPLWRDLAPLDYFYIKFEEDTWLHTTCWLVSRKLTELAGHWWELRTPDDDGEYFCRVVASSERIHFVPTARSYWRVGNYASFSYNKARSIDALEAFLESTFRCIQHFRSLEDSERSRSACVTFLRNRLIYFYPEHPELVQRMYAVAEELGGTLSEAPLGGKYDAIRSYLGWRMAKRSQTIVGNSKVWASRNWDKLMSKIT
jgi:glycosyltransferase involved in cell wall biosynthesis